MKNIIKCTEIFFALLLTTGIANAQYFNTYKSYDAVMVNNNNNTSTQITLRNVTMILAGNYNVLNVKLNIPFRSIDHKPEDAMFAQNLFFDLKVNINFNQVQQGLTSTKTFTTHSFLTLNNITRTVKVQYMPLPVGTDMNGNFKISMNIFLNPAEFNLGDPNNNSQFIIIISNAKVNRV
ncbi:MAG: hypothetical protein JWO92_2435 [Chitinophagaceae bacterium]|nr:hypothetical protein [Chitinophagaceae bacterium]